LDPVEGCIACDVHRGATRPPGGTVYEDDLWVADHGLTRLVRGYLVLKPRRHVHEFADLTDEEALAFGFAARTVLAAMRSALGPERIYICSFAETVHHLHFHLLPRYADMPGLGPDLMQALFSEKWQCTIAEAEDAAAQIRAATGT
jgi:diadenosine tetraphosphate (Ap4A) HIT family hydrolase